MSNRDDQKLIEDAERSAAGAGTATMAELSESTTIINTEMLQRARSATDAHRQAYLIVIAGPHVGRMFKIEDGQLTLGRSSKADLEITDVGISRQHARIERRGDDVRVVDLQSANGTYVNGRRVADPWMLQQGDKITLGSSTILKFTFQDKLDEDFQRQMLDAALRDSLTGAFNKNFLMNFLRAELASARRRGSELGMIMFDLDHFKKTNDTFGHLAGDHILAEVGRLVLASLPDHEKFVRYGGEEFAVVCPNASVEQAARLGNRLRKLIDSTDFVFEGQPIPVTVSVGVSGFPAVDAASPEDLIGAADRALYAAKNAGRNRVMVKGS